MSDEIQGEVAEARMLVGGLPPEPYETTVNGTPILCLPPNWSSWEKEGLLPNPQRIRVQEKFQELTSWIDYVNRFKSDGSVVFIGMTPRSLEAHCTLDYHERGQAHWCAHQALFTTVPTPAWNAWSQADGKFMRQSEFADFLYQNMREVVEPKGAELLEVITTLKATAAGEFREMRDDFSGSSELIYRMKVSAQGGTTEKPLTLPNRFDISVVPFYGCPEMRLQADLRVRPPERDGDPLTLGFRFYRLEDELHGLGQSIVGLIMVQTELPVWS